MPPPFQPRDEATGSSERWCSRARLAVFFGLGAYATCLWLPLILTGRGVYGWDIVQGFHPLWSFGKEWISQGVFPLWNPHVMSGVSYFNEPHGFLYPLHVFFYLLPIGTALPLTMLLHTWLGGLFTYGLSRSLRQSRWAAVFGAVVFMFAGISGPMVWSGHIPRLEATAWIPALAWAWVAIRSSPSAKSVLLGALALGLQTLTGHPQFVFYTVLMLALWSAFDCVVAWRRGKFAYGLRCVLALMGMGLLGLALAAFVLLPAFQWSAELARGGTFDFASSLSMRPLDALTAFVPDLFGDWYHVPFIGPSGRLCEHTVYLGALVLPLALLGTLRTHCSDRLFLILLAVIGLGLALGRYSPLFRVAYHVVPGLDMFRFPGRAFVMTMLATTILSGWGLDRLREDLRDGSGVRLTIGIFGAFTFVSLMAVALIAWAGPSWVEFARSSTTELDPEDVTAVSKVALSSATAVLVFVGLGLLLVVAAVRWPRCRRWTPLLFCFLCAIDLGGYGRRYLEPMDASLMSYPESIVSAITEDSSEVSGRLTLLTNTRHMNLGMIYGVDNIGGISGGVTHRYDRFMLRALGFDERASPLLELAADQFVPQFQLLNLGAIVLPNDPAHIDYLVSSGFAERVATAGDVAVVRLLNALPNIWVVPRAIAASSVEEAIDIVFSNEFDPLSQVVLETEDALQQLHWTPQPVPSTFERATPNAVEIDITLEHSGYVVLSEMAAPGWRAWANDEEVHIYPANGVLRAVFLSPGVFDDNYFSPLTTITFPHRRVAVSA